MIAKGKVLSWFGVIADRPLPDISNSSSTNVIQYFKALLPCPHPIAAKDCLRAEKRFPHGDAKALSSPLEFVRFSVFPGR
jgi:hypothetical protein